jgi:hypothetical protein
MPEPFASISQVEIDAIFENQRKQQAKK